MKKLRLVIEELAVETFDVSASVRGRKGTVEARADTSRCTDPQTYRCEGTATYFTLCVNCVESVDICYRPSEGPDVAMCAPTHAGEECETGSLLCPM
jgi:hypothetical protein